jgi:hypothetical protein
VTSHTKGTHDVHYRDGTKLKDCGLPLLKHMRGAPHTALVGSKGKITLSLLAPFLAVVIHRISTIHYQRLFCLPAKSLVNTCGYHLPLLRVSATSCSPSSTESPRRSITVTSLCLVCSTITLHLTAPSFWVPAFIDVLYVFTLVFVCTLVLLLTLFAAIQSISTLTTGLTLDCRGSTMSAMHAPLALFNTGVLSVSM